MPIFGWLAESGNQTFAQVLFAWRFRLVVKLSITVLVLYPTTILFLAHISQRHCVRADPLVAPSLRFTAGNAHPSDPKPTVTVLHCNMPTGFSQMDGGIHIHDLAEDKR